MLFLPKPSDALKTSAWLALICLVPFAGVLTLFKHGDLCMLGWFQTVAWLAPVPALLFMLANVLKMRDERGEIPRAYYVHLLGIGPQSFMHALRGTAIPLWPVLHVLCLALGWRHVRRATDEERWHHEGGWMLVISFSMLALAMCIAGEIFPDHFFSEHPWLALGWTLETAGALSGTAILVMKVLCTPAGHPDEICTTREGFVNNGLFLLIWAGAMTSNGHSPLSLATWLFFIGFSVNVLVGNAIYGMARLRELSARNFAKTRPVV